MKKKGFILLQVVIGIFLLGLVSVVSLNMLNFSSIYFQKAEENMEIDYIVEMIMENLKSKDQASVDFLNSLTRGSESDYPLPDIYKDRYNSKISLTEDHDYLWCFKLVVYRKNNKGRIIYEDFKASIPK